MAKKVKILIGGQWTEAGGGATFETHNPATGQVIAHVPLCGPADVKAAVGAARDAFDGGAWSRLPPGGRAQKLLKWADLIEANTGALAKLETQDQGKTIKQSRDADLPFAIDNIRFFAGACRTLNAPASGEFMDGATSILRREPLGVVAGIVPWNYPLMIAVWKAAPALAAGNSIVLKPSSQTPLSCLELARLAHEAGIPEGVVNVVTGPGSSVGKALAESKGIDLISLTGGTATGGELMASASTAMKRIQLELGGKAPFVIRGDADFQAAVTGAIVAAWWNGGQDCTQACRFIVHASIHDRFVKAFIAGTKRIRIGDPQAESTDFGPLVSSEHRGKVEGFVQRGQDAGAKASLKGSRPSGHDFAPGFYLSPTVFTDCSQDMEIVQQEIFGPAVTVQSFTTDEDALDLANGVTQGLYGSVWTRDIRIAHRFANELDFGTVCINDHLPLASEMPHGGFKSSGFGKDLSIFGLEEYTRAKHVLVDLAGLADKPWHKVVYRGGG